MAVDIDATLVVNKKGTEAVGQLAEDYKKAATEATKAGDAMGYAAEQAAKMKAASSGGPGGAGVSGGGFLSGELGSMIGGGALAAGIAAAGAAVLGLSLTIGAARTAVNFLWEESIAGAQRAVAEAIQFETVMTRIKVLSNSSADDMKLYNDQLLQMGPAVGKAPQELAEGLLRITSLGKTGAEALEILNQSAKLSAVGMGDTATIGRALTAVINSYGKENMSAAQAADILTATVREGGAEADAYAGTLGRIAPLAAQLGIRFADLGANLAAFTRLGVSASEATTGISGFMAALITPTNKGKEALAEYGLTYAKVRHQIQDEGLAQTMVGLMETFKGNDEALRAFLPNIRALRDQLAVAGDQGGEYLAIQDRIRNSTGDAAKAFEETTKTVRFQLDQLNSSLKSAALEVGQTLLPAFSAVVASISSELVPVLSDLVKWFAKNKDEISSGMIGALGELKNLISGVVTEFGELKSALEGLAGGPITQWLKEQYDEWLMLDNILARISGRESMSDVLAKGQAARNKAYQGSQEYSDLSAHFNTPQAEYQSPGTPTTMAEVEAMKAAAQALRDKRAAEEAAADAAKNHAEAMKAAATAAKAHEKVIQGLIQQYEGLGVGNQNVQAIEETLTRMGGAAGASAEFVHKFGKELSEAQTAGVKLSAEGEKLVALYNDQLTAKQLNQDLDKTAAAADKAFKASEKAINGIMREMAGLGTGKKDITQIEESLKRMGPAGIKSGEAVKKFGKELLEAAEASVPLSEAAEEVVSQWLMMKDANATIAEQKKLIEGLGPSVEQLAVKYAALSAAIEKVKTSPEGMNAAQRKAAIAQLEAMREQIVAAHGDTSKLDADLAALGANAGLQRAMEIFSQIAELAGRVGDEIGGWGGDALKTAGKAGAAYKSGQSAMAGGAGTYAVGAASTAVDIYQDNKHNMSATSATLNGAARGAAYGAAAGPYGMVIGAIVGGLIGFFSGSKFRGLVKEASGILGTEVSQQLAEKIEKTMKTLKLKDVKSAVLLNLDEAITESGKAASTFAPQMKDLIKGIADGSVPAKQGMDQLTKSFGLLQQEAAKSKTSLLAMFQVMQQARESKIMTDEMKQAISDAVDAMGQAIGNTNGLKVATEESARAQADIFALVWNQTVAEKGIRAAAETLGPALEELVKRLGDGKFAEAAAALLDPIKQQYALATNELFAGASDAAMGYADILKNAINTAMPLTIEQLHSFGTAAQDAYDQAKQAALDMGLTAEQASKQALLAIAPLLQEQVKAAEAYGIPLDENTQKLVDQAKAAGIAFAEDPMDRAAAAMERVADALEKVLHLTNETTKGFDALGNSANNVRPPTTTGGGNGGNNGGDYPPYAAGGIFRGPSSGSLAMLHGTEAVMTLPQLYGEMAGIISQATAELLQAGGGSGGGTIVYAPRVTVGDVYIQVDGGAPDGGLEEFGRKWKRTLELNSAEAETNLNARIDKRIKALAK